MSSLIFCCTAIKPYRPQPLLHENKFGSFINWAAFPKESEALAVETNLAEVNPAFVVQFVRQVNFGRLETKRYFMPVEKVANEFVEVMEDDLLRANFQKLNSYKNYKCEAHNKFFELNIYQKDPVNEHHWRATLARPARDIDLGERATHDVAAVPSSTTPGHASPRINQGGLGCNTAKAGENSVFQVLNDSPFPCEILHLHQVLETIFSYRTGAVKRNKNELLRLIAFDDLKSGLASVGEELDVGFERMWSQHLNARSIMDFILACNEGTPTVSLAREQSSKEGLATIFADMLQADVNSPGDHNSRDLLIRILQESLNRDDVDDTYKLLIQSALPVVEFQTGKVVEKDENRTQGAHHTSNNQITDEEDVVHPWRLLNLDDRYDDDDRSVRDFTACDQECGYCGHCDY